MASFANMVAPWALLFLGTVIAPGSSQVISSNLIGNVGILSDQSNTVVTAGALHCTTGLLNCPETEGSCAPLANVTVSLSLDNNTTLGRTITNAMGGFQIVNTLSSPLGLNMVLGSLPRIMAQVDLPVAGCPSLPSTGILSSAVAAVGGSGTALDLVPILFSA